MTAFREAIVEVLGRLTDGRRLTDTGWPVRYALRRFAWHALDHAWGKEDRQ